MSDHRVIEYRIEKISKGFSGQPVLKDFTTSFSSGKVVGLLGPNGAGKTTLFKCFLGLYSYTGKIELYDSISTSSSLLQKQDVSGMVGAPSFYESLSVQDNIHMALAYTDKSMNDIQDYLEQLGVDKFLSKKVHECSLGMRQRVAIAMALIKDSRLLLLDEPMNGLDPEGIKELREFLKDLCHGNDKTVLISSHILSEMALLCDSVIFLNHGQCLGKSENMQDLENQYMALIQSK